MLIWMFFIGSDDHDEERQRLEDIEQLKYLQEWNNKRRKKRDLSCNKK